MHDISTVLAFEVKKELAERYFGFRKLIEDDTVSYREQIVASAIELDTKIGYDLVQIYTCLQSTKLIERFLELIKLEDRLYFDDFIHSSEQTRKKVFSCKRVNGLTRKSRLRNSLFDSYKDLYEHINEYNNTIEGLNLKHETIREQINLFYQKNDFSGMMQFLHNLDTYQADAKATMSGQQPSFEKMERNMQITPPPTVDQFLPEIPKIRPLKEVKKQLKKLIDETYHTYTQLDPRNFCS